MNIFKKTDIDFDSEKTIAMMLIIAGIIIKIPLVNLIFYFTGLRLIYKREYYNFVFRSILLAIPVFYVILGIFGYLAGTPYYSYVQSVDESQQN